MSSPWPSLVGALLAPGDGSLVSVSAAAAAAAPGLDSGGVSEDAPLALDSVAPSASGAVVEGSLASPLDGLLGVDGTEGEGVLVGDGTGVALGGVGGVGIEGVLIWLALQPPHARTHSDSAHRLLSSLK